MDQFLQCNVLRSNNSDYWCFVTFSARFLFLVPSYTTFEERTYDDNWLIKRLTSRLLFSSFFCLLCPLPEEDFLDSFMERAAAGISNPYPINVWQKWISSTFFSLSTFSSAPIYLNLVLGAMLSKKWGEEQRWSPLWLWLHCTRTKVIASKLINTYHINLWTSVN